MSIEWRDGDCVDAVLRLQNWLQKDRQLAVTAILVISAGCERLTARTNCSNATRLAWVRESVRRRLSIEVQLLCSESLSSGNVGHVHQIVQRTKEVLQADDGTCAFLVQQPRRLLNSQRTKHNRYIYHSVGFDLTHCC